MKRFLAAVLLFCMLLCLDKGEAWAAEEQTGIDVVAHRGYSAKYPENTLVSFYQAVAGGATMVELDVRRTKGGKLVVFHDEDLSRVMGQETKKSVADISFEEVKAIDAGSYMGQEFAGIGIPSLEETLAFFKDYDVTLVVELKSIENDKGFVKQAYNMVKKYDMLDRVIFASFSGKYLRQVKKLNWQQPTMKFDSKGNTNMVRSCYADYYGVNAYALTRELVDIVHQAGLQVYAYTPVNMDEVKAMESLGVDGVIINYPSIELMGQDQQYQLSQEKTVTTETAVEEEQGIVYE